MDPLNPLSEEHLARIVAAISSGEQGLQAIAKAKSAGIDTQDAEHQLRAALEKLRAIRQVYFPGR